jgi:DNA (cytosine-5)-methyltransferase 1
MSNTAPVRNVVTSSRPSYLEILDQAWAQHLAPREAGAPTVISTFAGCGGSSLGYSMAGYRELLAVEWDQNAVDTFRLNFPDVPVWHGDIVKLSVDECLERAGIGVGELDVFDGSPPCQGFSTAGKREMADPRNQLFREYVRLLRGLQPKVFVMENVSGMVKGKMKLIFADILRELKASGYVVSARLMNAMYFNVPQSRQRMIFIGVREDLGVGASHPKGSATPVIASDVIIEQDADNVLTEHQLRYWHAIKPGQSGRHADGRNVWFNFIKMHPWEVAPTVCKGAGNAKHCHWSYPGALNMGGYKKLASFPVPFQFAGSYSEMKSRIGNSVPPLFMRSIAAHIREHILNA